MNKKNKKIVNIKELKEIINKISKENNDLKIVFTNGCFDILHRGHVEYLQKAKELGNLLILGLNSDSSVKRLKGENRPINNEEDRAIVLSALECVDFVIIFDDDTPFELIKNLKPDILVKGGDYKLENVIGREFAKETILIDFVDGYSTTKTIKNIKNINKINN